MLSRRTALLAGLGGLAATATACGDATVRQSRVPAVPDVAGGPVVLGELTSQRRLGERVRWAVTRPPGVSGPLPLVVALHGHGGGVGKLFGPDLSLPRYVAAAVAGGVPPFALAAVNGGNGFWHERPSGEDGGAMVAEELLPLLAARTDLEVLAGPDDRVGLLGWSMGGYGVLHLAPVLGADRVAAVCASSPGLYTDPAAAHPDGFADAAEYERFSVMDRQDELAGIPVRVSCGTRDYFFDAVQTYVEGFPDDADLTVAFGPGAHELAFTRRSLPDDLAFVASRLVG
ncbi:MAG: putative esterase [Nocardioides sp.]|nr:putative esterase [Nocardioides sp.]